MTREEIFEKRNEGTWKNMGEMDDAISSLLSECDGLKEKVKELESKEAGLKHFVEHELNQISPRLETKLKQAESRLKKLREAVDKYKQFIDDNWTDKGPARSWREFREAHEELYKVRNET